MMSNQEVWIGINIGNYDKGGHKVSANITIHDEESKAVSMQIVPLFAPITLWKWLVKNMEPCLVRIKVWK